MVFHRRWKSVTAGDPCAIVLAAADADHEETNEADRNDYDEARCASDGYVAGLEYVDIKHCRT